MNVRPVASQLLMSMLNESISLTLSLVGDLQNVVDDVRLKLFPADEHLESRNIKRLALAVDWDGRLGHGSWSGSGHRKRQDHSRRQIQRIVKFVVVGDGAPLCRVVVFRCGDAAERLTLLNDVNASVIRRLLVDLGDLLGQRFVFLERDRERGAQRNALRAEQRESLADTFDDALESMPLLAAGCCVIALSRKLIAPREETDWRRMRSAVDLDQLIKRIGQRRDGRRLVIHSRFGRVEEQVQRQRLGLSADKLENWRIESRDCDFGDLRGLVKRVFRRVKSDGERRAEIAVGIDFLKCGF